MAKSDLRRHHISRIKARVRRYVPWRILPKGEATDAERELWVCRNYKNRRACSCYCCKRFPGKDGQSRRRALRRRLDPVDME